MLLNSSAQGMICAPIVQQLSYIFRENLPCFGPIVAEAQLGGPTQFAAYRCRELIPGYVSRDPFVWQNPVIKQHPCQLP